MSVEFDTPANRIIQQLQPKNQFRIDTSLPDLAFLRQLSVQGRLRYFNSASADLTITPTEGETLFIYRITLNNQASTVRGFTILNDGNSRAVVSVGINDSKQIDFFDSLVGDSIKTILINGSASGTNISVLGWVENTARIRDVTT